MKDLIAEFDRLGQAGPPQRPQKLVGTACVLGGSIAGLCAARVLADYADQVVVVERDPIGDEAGSRAGVPQGQHVHSLLPGGLRWMERWFPGLTQEIQAGGGVLAGPMRALKNSTGAWVPGWAGRAAPSAKDSPQCCSGWPPGSTSTWG